MASVVGWRVQHHAVYENNNSTLRFQGRVQDIRVAEDPKGGRPIRAEDGPNTVGAEEAGQRARQKSTGAVPVTAPVPKGRAPLAWELSGDRHDLGGRRPLRRG